MSATRIVPFWNRLPAFALYPLKGVALASLLVFTLMIAIAGMAPIIGWLLAGLLWLGALKQAFEMLLATANGRMEAPEVSFDIGNGTVVRYVLLQLTVILVPLVVALVLGPMFGLVLLVALGVLMPAATIGLAISESLRVALNPEYLWRIASRIGWPYLAVVGLSLVIQYSAANADALLSRWLPGLLAGPLGTAFSLWALFATFHLMGYLVWQYHETLDFEPAPALTPGELPKTRDAELLERVEGLIASGEVDVALVHLRETVRDRAVDVAVHELYRRALKLKGDRIAVLEHAKLMLQSLIVSRQDRKALALLRESLAMDPHFLPFEIEDAERLAQAALQSGQTDVALALGKALIAMHPGHARLPHWALQASDLTLRRGEDPHLAKQWLSDAEAQCRDDEMLRRLGAQRAALGL
jgi:hypothetical protein